jgi:hypothetical protein
VSASPTARSLAHARSLGWPVDVVESWNAFARVRQDLFGMFDLLALDALPGSLGIQCTTGSHASNRVKKLTGNPALRAWLEAGNRAEVWSWRKAGARGEPKRWTLTRRAVTLADMEGS